MTEQIVKLGWQTEGCSYCGGYGMVGYSESVGECPRCDGAGIVEKRDAKGRFLPWETAVMEVEDD